METSTPTGNTHSVHNNTLYLFDCLPQLTAGHKPLLRQQELWRRLSLIAGDSVQNFKCGVVDLYRTFLVASPKEFLLLTHVFSSPKVILAHFVSSRAGSAASGHGSYNRAAVKLHCTAHRASCLTFVFWSIELKWCKQTRGSHEVLCLRYNKVVLIRWFFLHTILPQMSQFIGLFVRFNQNQLNIWQNLFSCGCLMFNYSNFNLTTLRTDKVIFEWMRANILYEDNLHYFLLVKYVAEFTWVHFFTVP